MNLSKLIDKYPDDNVVITCHNLKEKIQLMELCNNTLENDWDVEHFSRYYPDYFYMRLRFDSFRFIGSSHSDKPIYNVAVQHTFKELMDILQENVVENNSSPIINDDYELI